MFPVSLPALRINLRSFFGAATMSPGETEWRTEGLIAALTHGGVLLRGVSIDPDGDTWIVFKDEKDRHDVHATLQAVLREMKHAREEAEQADDQAWLSQ